MVLKLAIRNLRKHPLRTFLTTGALVVALFLLCTLQSVVTSLRDVAETSRSNRLWVQSAVSLFVDLPLSYPAKIEAVEGVGRACKWQWFGGYYQDPSNFFGQFAVDEERLLDMYPEIEIVSGSREGFLGKRTACLVGKGIADKFGWEVGDRIPIIGALFPHPDGTDTAWEFDLEAIYTPTAANFDDRTFFFHWDYFQETLEGSEDWIEAVGAIVIEIEPSVQPTTVMATVDGLFENGPQRVQTTTEAEFQAQFVTMFGNVPFFVSAIGGGVLVAILLACVNTMLMAAREQTHDIGILKAVGFGDGKAFLLLLVQSLLLTLTGGLLGIGLALSIESTVAATVGQFLPGYSVASGTIVLGVVLSLLVGVVAGVFPALRAGRLSCVDALGGTE